jgi:hypothetical protein
MALKVHVISSTFVGAAAAARSSMGDLREMVRHQDQRLPLS